MNKKKIRKKRTIRLTAIILALIAAISLIFSYRSEIVTKNGIITSLLKADNTDTGSSSQLLVDAVSVGDYIQYNPDVNGTHTYQTQEAKTGSSNVSTFSSTDNIKWKVLSIDKSTGKIEIIAEDGTPSTITFEGTNGIKNYMDVLNEASSVYGYGIGAVSARSINFDDIDKYAGITFGTETTKITTGKVLVGNEIVDASSVPGGVEVVCNFNAYPINVGPKNSEAIEVIARDSNGYYKSFFVDARTYSSHGTFYNMCVYNNGNAIFQPCMGYYIATGIPSIYSGQNGLRVLPIVELDSNLRTSGKDSNGWVIVDPDETPKELFQAQIELSKVKGQDFSKVSGSTFKVEDITEKSDLQYKIYNPTNNEELQLNEQEAFEMPSEGIIISITGQKREFDYKLKITEVSVPEDAEKDINYLVLNINISTDDVITSKIEKIEDSEGNEIELAGQKNARLIGSDENGISSIRLDDTDTSMEIEYHLGDEPTDVDTWTKYTGELVLQENAKIWARAKNKNGVTSAYAVKVVNNIDKIAPSVDRDTFQLTANMATKSLTLTAKIQDLESDENVAQGLKKFGASGIVKYGLCLSHTTEPRNTVTLDKVKEANITIDNIKESGSYYLWMWDAAGNIGKEEFEIRKIVEENVARIVSVSVEDGSNKYDNLVGTEYTTLRAAIDACPPLGEGTATIQIIANIEDESNEVDRDVTIDLAGYSINTLSTDGTTPTLDVLDNCKLIITDSVGTGLISNKKSDFTYYDGYTVGIAIEEKGFLQLGYDDGNVNTEHPTIEGEGYGIYNKGQYVNETWNGGTFNFYDGMITAEQVNVEGRDLKVAIFGDVSDTPLFWRTSISNPTEGAPRQVAVLAMISDAEVRIGRKTYTQIEDAIEDAGTKYGTDGSQVEIVLLTNLSKKNTVVIDKTKNIKLDLNGFSFTTQGTGYVINNSGNLEIIDTSEEKTGKIYGTTNDAIYNESGDVITSTKQDIDLSTIKKYNEDDEGYFEYNPVSKTLTSVGDVTGSVPRTGYIELDLTNYDGWYRLTGFWNIVNRNNVRIAVTTEPMKLSLSSGSSNYAFYFNLKGGRKYYINLIHQHSASAEARFIQQISLYKINLNKLTVTSGTIESNKSTISGIKNKGYLEVNGGIFTSKSGAYCINNINQGNTVINDGKFSSTYSGIGISARENGGFVTINGGSFDNYTGVEIDSETQQIEIKGGTFNCTGYQILTKGSESNTNNSSDSLIIVKDVNMNLTKSNTMFVLGSNGRLIIDNSNITANNKTVIKNSKVIDIINNSNITAKNVINSGNTYNIINSVLTSTDTTISGSTGYIDNSTITSNRQAITGAKNLLVTGNSEITADGNIVEASSDCNIVIESGHLESGASVVLGTTNNIGGNIVIGKKDGNANESPTLKSPETACTINTLGSDVYFYDGKLIGKVDNIVNSSIVEIEEGTEIISTISGNMEELTLGNSTEIIENVDSGTKYKSIQEAIDGCSEDGSLSRLRLLKNVNVASSNYINENKNIEFDLNGKQLRIYSKEAIKNVGNLTIKSSVEEEQYNIYAVATSNTISNDVILDGESEVHRGNLKFDGVKFYYDSDISSWSSNDILNYGSVTYSRKKLYECNQLIVNKGDMELENVNIVKRHLGNIVNAGNGNIVMKSGIITLNEYSTGFSCLDNSNLTLETGEIIGGTKTHAIYNLGNGTIKIKKLADKDAFKFMMTNSLSGITSLDADSHIDIEDVYINSSENAYKANGIYSNSGDVNIDEATFEGSFEHALYASDCTIKNADLTINGSYLNQGNIRTGVPVLINKGTIKNISIDGTGAADSSVGGMTLYGDVEIDNMNIDVKGLAIKIGTYGTYSSSSIIYGTPADVTIKDGTIKGETGIDVAGASKATINHANIEATLVGINLSSDPTDSTGVCQFKSGTINSEDRGIKALGKRKIIIGEKLTDEELNNGGVPSVTDPSITGKNVGVEFGNSAVGSFYDGIIVGAKDSAIIGPLEVLETSYQVDRKNDDENNTETATLKQLKMFEIVGVKDCYSITELQQSINALDNGTSYTVKVLIDFDITELNDTLVIPEGKEIVFDINGKKIECHNSETLQNNGKLTLTDSTEGNVEDKAGHIRSLKSGTIIKNSGTMDIEDIHILYTRESGENKGIVNEGNMNIENSIITTTYEGINISNINSGNLYIKSGTIEASDARKQATIYNSSDGVLDISGGYLDVSKIQNDGSGELKISGDCTITVGANGIENTGTGKTTISGGTFTKEPSISYYTPESDSKSHLLHVSNGSAQVSNTTIYSVSADEGTTLTVDNENTEITYIRTEGTTTINDGTIHRIRVFGGTTSINGGKVQATQGSAIYIDGGTVNIGANDGQANKDAVQIIGQENTATITRTTDSPINFYGGTIKSIGTQLFINSYFTALEENFDLQIDTENENYTAYLIPKNNIFSVNSVGYNTLTDAVNACNASTNTIIVEKNYNTIEKGVVIPSGKNIVLDTNGKEIGLYGDDIYITNNGTFSIVDGSTDGKGVINNYSPAMIINNGTLDINIVRINNYWYLKTLGQCCIKNANTVNWNSGKLYLYSENEDNYRSGITNEGTSTINWNNGYLYVQNGIGAIDGKSGTINWIDGEIFNSGATGSILNTSGNLNITTGKFGFAAPNSNTSFIYGGIGSTIKIDDFKTTSHSPYIGREYNCVSGSPDTLTINGGTFEGFSNDLDISYDNSSDTSKKGNVYIKGGTFNRVRISEKEQVEITGGTIKSLNLNGQVLNAKLNGGTISQNSTSENAVNLTNGAKFIFESGNIENTSGTAVVIEASPSNTYKTTFTMGTDDSAVKVDKPIISAGKYGVSNESTGVFKFYDGTISGNNKAIFGTVNEVPTNYKVNYINNELIAQLALDLAVEDVVSINNQNFGSLQEAIEAATTQSLLTNSNVTIKVKQDIDLATQIEIEENAKITIDLNSYKVTYTESSNPIFVNNGTLAIIDSTYQETESGKIVSTEGYAIQNNGTLIIGYEEVTDNIKTPSIQGKDNAIDNKGTLILYSGMVDNEYVTRGTQVATLSAFRVFRIAQARTLRAVNQVGEIVSSVSLPIITVDSELPVWTNDHVTANMFVRKNVQLEIIEPNEEEPVTDVAYTIHYYYPGEDGTPEEDTSKMESLTGQIGSSISSYPDKSEDKFELDKAITFDAEGNEKDLPLVLVSDASKNVINVYYKAKEEIIDKYDLSLQKFVSDINGKKITTREPRVKVSEDGKISYEKNDEIEKTANNQTVTYTIRMYNESEVIGKGKRVIEYIPEGLVFIPEAEINTKYEWRMYKSDNEGKLSETKNAEEAVLVVTDYLVDKTIDKFDREAKKVSYLDVEALFKVDETKITSEDRIIENKVQIMQNINDENRKNDITTEKLYVKYFDLDIEKYIEKVIVENDDGIKEETYGYSRKGELVKVDVRKSQVEKTKVTVIYGIVVKNIGEIPGKATEVVDYAPEGFKLVQDSIWSMDDRTAITDSLADIVLEPGESTILNITFEWNLSESTIGLKSNEAHIATYTNEFNARDLTEDNRGRQDMLVTVKTGSEIIKYSILGLAWTAIVSTGLILVKRKIV